MTTVKRTALFLSRGMGLNSLLRRSHRSHLLSLGYHGVSVDEHIDGRYANSEEGYLHRNTISVERFRRQMDLVVRYFSPISAPDLLAYFRERRRLPPRPVLITFDDGFRNNLTCAVPELEQRGIPALFNIATGFIESRQILWTLEVDQQVLSWPSCTLPVPGNSDEIPLPAAPLDRIPTAERIRGRCKSIADSDRREYLNRLRERHLIERDALGDDLTEWLTWDDVRTLHRKGFAIGAHSVDHPVLTRLPQGQLLQQLGESQRMIEQATGVPCPYLAYPNGGHRDVSPEVIAAARDCGFDLGFTLTGQFQPLDGNPLTLSRICVDAETTLPEFHAKISGLYALLNR